MESKTDQTRSRKRQKKALTITSPKSVHIGIRRTKSAKFMNHHRHFGDDAVTGGGGVEHPGGVLSAACFGVSASALAFEQRNIAVYRILGGRVCVSV